MKRHLMAVTVLAGLLACAGASAQPEGRYGPRGPHVLLDARYHHDHYYPARGEAYGVLPGGSVSVVFRGGNWFYHGGVWFRPSGGRFIVDVPPVGIVVPLLPPDYAMLSIGGAPYYYANGIYYAQAPGQGYVVVDPPPGADSAEPLPPPLPQQPPPPPPPPPSQPVITATPRMPVPSTAPKAAAEPIYYPRTGQSPSQTEADRQECNRWATTQSGAMADASVFQRASAACMDAHGYTVR